MKLWDRRFKDREDIPILERFNSSIEKDRFLWQEEIDSSIGYAKALRKAKILTKKEADETVTGLYKVKKRIKNGEDITRFEDIHSAVELMLIEEIGQTGKKIHTQRSRNEQVVTDERLYLKKKIPLLIEAIKRVQASVIKLAENNFDIVMPAYTHLQQAQCVLFSHYIMSLFWSLQRSVERVKDLLKRVDKLPLGSGALAGTTLAIDRKYLCKIIGFRSETENSIDAVSDRSFILEALFVFSVILMDLGRYAEDFIIFSSSEFGYLILDDSISTSSSLMPQKRNPDFLELVRASSGSVFGNFVHLFTVLKGIPLTYNKDLQEDKVPLYNGVESTLQTLEVFDVILNNIKLNKKRIHSNIDPSVFATDMVDYLVNKGIAFREAYDIVGEIICHVENIGKRLNKIKIDELRKFSPLFDDDLFNIFDPVRSIKQKKSGGSTNPEEVRRQIESAKKIIQ